MKKVLTLFAILVLANHFQSQAQFYKYSNEFLNIGVGARGLGMSGAVIANTNDVTSAFWNPAGLAHIDKKFDLGLMQSEYFSSYSKYYYGIIDVQLKQRQSD